MGILNRSKAFQRRDGGGRDLLDRRDAGARRLAVDDHRACAALGKAASELRPAQLQVVAEHVEQRSGRIDVHRVHPAVDDEGDDAHTRILSPRLA